MTATTTRYNIEDKKREESVLRMLKNFCLFLVAMVVFLLATASVCYPRDELGGGRGSFLKYGVGLYETSDKTLSSSKLFSLGYISEFLGPLVRQYEVGAYFDNSHREGASGSGFADFAIGLDVRPGDFVARSTWGAGAITSPDTILGGWFQFTQDLYLGITDKTGNAIGLNYKHISSAGIYKQNKGRDFLTVQVSIPW